MKKHYVIIADIVNSRKIESKNRNDYQIKINEKLAYVNEKFENYIESKLGINFGDSFQGVFNEEAPIQLICLKLYFLFYPFCKIRIGIGYGEISTSIIKEHSFSSDGIAFWKAREAVQESKKKNIDICFLSTGSDIILNTIKLHEKEITSIMKSWTSNQKNIAEKIILYYNFEYKQKDIAEKLEKSEQVISKTLKSMNMELFIELCENIQLLIDYLREE